MNKERVEHSYRLKPWIMLFAPMVSAVIVAVLLVPPFHLLPALALGLRL